MIEENNNSDKKIEEIFSHLKGYMTEKIKKRIEIIKGRLEDIKNSNNKNKDEIALKLEKLIEVMNKVIEKTELQAKTQEELFDLMGSMENLDKEIDDLLIK